MSLLPEEEEAFAALVAQLARPASRIPWAPVALGALVAGEGVDSAVLLGADSHMAIVFWMTFVLGMTVGLWCMARARRPPSAEERRR